MRTMVLAALCAIVVMGSVTRAIAGSWTHPSSVAAAAWGLFLLLPTIAGLRSSPFTSFVIVLVVLGALISASFRVRALEVQPSAILSTKGLSQFVICGALSGGAAGLLTLRANGLNPSTSFSLAAINLAAQQATVLRYASALIVPSLAIFLLAMTYAAALAAPYAAAQSHGLRKAALLAAPTAGGGLFAVATTARAGFLITAVITTGSWLTTLGILQGGRARLPAKAIFGLIVSAAGLALLFVYSALTRIGGWRPGVGRELLDKVVLYAGGGVPAFESWMSNGGNEAAPLGFGSETIAGISQFWVRNPAIGNAYKDRVDIGLGMSTNVYTMLRPLTQDFTVAGAVLLLTVCAVVAAIAYRHAVLCRSVHASILVSVWLGVVLFGSTTSILTFTNVCFGLAVGWYVIGRTTRFMEIGPLPVQIAQRATEGTGELVPPTKQVPGSLSGAEFSGR